MSEVLEQNQHRGISGSIDLHNTNYRVVHILQNGANGDGDTIVLSDEKDKRIAVITYKLIQRGNDMICEITFFGTKNGFGENYSILNLLDIDTDTQKGLSYSVMTDFIANYCVPNNVKRIYMYSDIGPIYPGATLSKKEFWKGKMGSFLIKKGIATQVTSQSSEICFVLKT